jgi:hypothetical protein
MSKPPQSGTVQDLFHGHSAYELQQIVTPPSILQANSTHIVKKATSSTKILITFNAAFTGT